jgi:hypothetical protein
MRFGSIGQAEYDPDYRWEIHAFSVPACGLELNVARGLDCGLIEAKSKAASYANNSDAPVRAEHNVNYDFSLNSMGDRFLRIKWCWFAQDPNARGCGRQERSRSVL